MLALAATLFVIAASPRIEAWIGDRVAGSTDAIRWIVAILVAIDLGSDLTNATQIACAAVGVAAGVAIHRIEDRLALIGWVAAAVAVGLHGVGDGLALSSGRNGAPLLGLAMAIHTLPVSIAMLRVGRDASGSRRGHALLAACAVGTVIGFAVGDVLPASYLDPAMALAAGWLLGAVAAK